MQPLISPSKLFKYSITFEETTEDSRETSDYSNSGYIIYNESDIIGNILKKANQVYGIYYPIYFGGWESTYPEQDRDYFEKGVEKYYTLFVENEDGTDISTEEYDFITFLLSNGEYNSEDFQEYAVGGIVAGAVALGVAGLIGYYYFNKRKKGYPTGSAWTKEHYHDNENEDYEVEPSKRKVPARNRKYENGGKTEEVYIEFLNKEKGYKKDVKHFNSYKEAVEWAKKNFDKFDYDMIKYKYANGGQIIRFDRHASMDSATRNELVEMLSYPFLLEYDVEENGEIKYDRIKFLLEREGVKVYSIKNYLSGLFDGYNYSNTDDFKKEMAKLKIADKEFYDRIIKVYEKISKYPKIDKMMDNGGRVKKMYYHIIEYGDYGNIGYQGYYETKEEAQKQVDKLSDYFPNQTFQIFVDNSKKEPPITTMKNGGEIQVGNKFGDWSITQYKPIVYEEIGGTRDGLIKLVNQDTFDEILVQYDGALRNPKWFARIKGVQFEGKSPKEVIEKLKFADGGDAGNVLLQVGDVVVIYPNYASIYTNSKGEIVDIMPDNKTYEVKIKNTIGNEYVKFDKSELKFINGKGTFYNNGGGVENAEMPTRERTTITRPTTTPTTTPSKPDKNNPYKPKHKPKPKAKKYDFILIKK